MLIRFIIYCHLTVVLTQNTQKNNTKRKKYKKSVDKIRHICYYKCVEQGTNYRKEL